MTIKQIIDERNKNFNDAQTAIKETIKKWTSKDYQAVYSQDYLIEQLKAELSSLQLALTEADKGFNVALNREVANIRDSIKGHFFADFEKPADYSTQITNALQMITMIGNKLDDKTASTILEPFKNDFEQLAIFNSILLHTIQDSNELDERFSETFDRYNTCKSALDTCEKMIEIAKSLFVHKKCDDLNNGITFYGQVFSGQYDGYDEIDGQQKIVELETELERGAE